MANDHPTLVASVVRAMKRGPEHEEELWNAGTHGLGWVASVIGAVVLMGVVAENGSGWQVVGCAIYGLTMVGTYAASTLSHVYRRPRVRDFFRMADQALIFLFIAGSFTPMALTWLGEVGGGWLLGGMWSVALVGFISKAGFSHKVHVGMVTTWLYVVLGWMPMLMVWPMVRAMPGGLLIALLVGGGFYTLGLVFFHFDDRVRFCHTAWHLAVVAGSVCHYLGILIYCTGEVGA